MKMVEGGEVGVEMSQIHGGRGGGGGGGRRRRRRRGDLFILFIF